MRLANRPILEDHIQELELMHWVYEEEIDAITWPTTLFTQPYELDFMELVNAETTLAKN